MKLFRGLFVVCILSALHVQSQTVWKSATDGHWSDPLAWSAGLPDFNAAYLTNTLDSYTVQITDGAEAKVSDLFIKNTVPRTTRLEITNGTLHEKLGSLSIEKGGSLILSEGGNYLYEMIQPDSKNFGSIWGLLRLEGGTFFAGSLDPHQRINPNYLRLFSSGRLEMTGGKMEIWGASKGGLYSNTGTLDLSGGTLLLVNTNDVGGCTSLHLKDGSLLQMTGTSSLITSNAFYIESNQGQTTRVEIDSPDALFQFASATRGGRPQLTASGNGRTEVNLRRGTIIWGDEDDFSETYLNTNAKDAYVGLNVWEGGNFRVKQLVIGRDRNSGMSEINVHGGVFEVFGGGTCSVARDSSKKGVIAKINLSGGIFDMSDPKKFWWNNNSGPALSLGWNWNYPNKGNSPMGAMDITGGIISNSGATVAGLYNKAKGTITQSGGIFRQGFGFSTGKFSDQRIRATGTFVLGFSSGEGIYTLSNGVFECARDFFVGGADGLSRWGMTTIYVHSNTPDKSVAPGSSGTLSLLGGSMLIKSPYKDTTATFHVGDFGTGTVSVAESAVFEAEQVELHSSADGIKDSTLRFTLGPTGAGQFKCNKLTIDPGAKLVVDTRPYAGKGGWIRLIDSKERMGEFLPENIIVQGSGEIRQDRDAGIWLLQNNGTIILLK